MITRTAAKPTIGRKAAATKNPKNHRIAKPSRSKQRRSKPKLTSLPGARPSDKWGSYKDVDKFHAKEIKYVFRTRDWNYLCSDAVDCRRRQSIAQGQPVDHGLTCDIRRTRFACGASNLVLEVAFSDLTYWIVRIRLPGDTEGDQEVEKSMHSELATMRLIQERTTIPVATIYGYNCEHDNPFGYHYMFMSALPGHHRDRCFALSVPQQHQAKVAAQLADILHQLSTKMTFESIGRIWCGKQGNEEPGIISFNASGACEGQLGKFPVGPFSTSLEYFYSLRQIENDAIQVALAKGVLGENVDKESWLVACRVFEQALCSSILREKTTGPFPLQHVDFQFNNILLDDDFNVTGITDWTGAQTVPCESFAICRELIVPPNASEEVSARTFAFRTMVKKAWQERELDRENLESVWPMSDLVGSTRSNLICFSYTSGALRRAVAYAQIVVSLLYGIGFTLETFKRNIGF